MRRPNLRDPDVADAIRQDRKEEAAFHAACAAADDAYYAALDRAIEQAAITFNANTNNGDSK